MKYMLLIYGEENALNETDREQCYRESAQLAHQLNAAGQFLATAPLQLTATATSLRVREGKRYVTDGPFAETREQLGGYFLITATDLDEAIAIVNSGAYGNQACLVTSSGASARKFRYEAEVGNVGINVGGAAPMAFFPFSGARESFFGDLHGQGRDAIEFFTQEKVVVERWPSSWSRRF